MKLVNRLAVLGLCVLFSVSAGISQETETKVVDEVVAVVNEGVITLSSIKREMKGIVDAKVQEGSTREDAQREVDEKKGELIANLINEELLIQKAKDLGLDSEIEANINARFVEIMKQNNLKTIDELNAVMKQQGVDPAELKEVWRKQFIRDLVLQDQVQKKVYWGFTTKEVKDYYDKNKSKFTKPETISVSELFLGFAGREIATVREKAKLLVTQARGGADFGTLVAENSDRPDSQTSKGKVEAMAVSTLTGKYADSLKGLKVGQITEPVEDETGISILRVDERSAASDQSVFNEGAVRIEMMKTKLPDAQKTFFADLRNDSYIKINDSYRPLVSPILFGEDRKEKSIN